MMLLSCVQRTPISELAEKNILELMQSRKELYNYLGYHEYEKKLDDLFSLEVK